MERRNFETEPTIGQFKVRFSGHVQISDPPRLIFQALTGGKMNKRAREHVRERKMQRNVRYSMVYGPLKLRFSVLHP